MTTVTTDLGNTRESARRLRVEPTGGITATNVQKALEALDSGKLSLYPSQQLKITSAGIVTIGVTTPIVLVSVAGLVTLNLPSVSAWVNQFPTPATGFERSIWIKDLGGNAASFNITVAPNGADKIDALSHSFTIVQNHQILRLYPLADLTGWLSG